MQNVIVINSGVRCSLVPPEGLKETVKLPNSQTLFCCLAPQNTPINLSDPAVESHELQRIAADSRQIKFNVYVQSEVHSRLEDFNVEAERNMGVNS
jgi:hypothetical protein